ncbi:hypothetical protein [Azonexus sp.]|uniref:hypothetical protein n=1 Tax=Azonexus sp. TaxID=1872668 RepID=UPI0035AF7539
MRILDWGKWLAGVAVWCVSWQLAIAGSGDLAVFESCVDARGRLLKAVSDPQLPVLVRATDTAGERSLRYNPDLLPRLSQGARFFLYTQECARVGLSDTGSGQVAERARIADCKAVNALLASGAVTRRELPAVQAELSFSPDEWSLLSGPQRTFELGSCLGRRGNVLAIPRAAPTAQQAGWNDCVRACGDRLWACQKRGCSGADCPSCQGSYESCQAACAGGPGK